MPPSTAASKKIKAKKAAAAPIDAAPTGSLPAGFKTDQARKAVDALLAYQEKAAAERERTELIARDEHVWLSINTKTGSTRKKLMPVKIQLPFPPLPPPPATSVCLITKDPQREYKDLLEEKGIKFVDRVVGVEKLRGKFKPFEPRRQLRNDHDLFLVDDRVLPMMPKLLGKMFFEAKKTPIPVNVLRKDLKAELGRAIACTYFHPSTGTSHSVRIATPSVTTAEETVANLLAAAPAAAELVGGWDNVLSVGIKTSTSVLLPVWNAPLTGRFKNTEDEMEVEEPKPKAKAVEKPKAAVKEKAAPALKKSSTVGSGAKKAKAAVVGSAKPKSKAKAK
ncbi:uncharacterized protein CcaverHIS019_0109890 [Cutaneotrichosporon cavernicola]|uniref:Ribosomal L1 domain-containing protein 1 n=1 Tax=Cutaneotrichosporon cavernicola TaxID=279322 RepID=A0AA48HZC6_9TREE|nr:uncharacterized protein CcaverHIS019_0109890 [Cutaneotrichosporon cavernicola]BEI88271.1 hypothetical protein CcaverHIS019_0109890 [Cutaneotrichosporon cavernicola]BEI96043.1 hypothetical protein CcaverHIS631_0109920 [Cutaneotrichosporon cavernicola]BEJ03815.1 hypothetical protein CcaverHIS641_0109900 [Cutaneotrichosporon cavernicola]